MLLFCTGDVACVLAGWHGLSPAEFTKHPVTVLLQGAIIYGCIRDSEDISKMPLGVKALATFPLKSSKRDPGLRDVPVTFAGVTVNPGDWLYADKDGVLISPEELKL